jgi:uncharacterized protein (DUF2147 family)
MSIQLREITALGAVALMSFAPVAARADSVLGVYQTTDRKMDYELSLCGKDEKALCVKLTGIRDTADIPRTRAYLHKYVVDRAKPAGTNRWKGKMNIAGYDLSGSLTLKPGVNFVMSGCAYVVVCDDFTLIPAK